MENKICKICKGKGYLPTEEKEGEETFINLCECTIARLKKKKTAKVLTEARIPHACWERSFESYGEYFSNSQLENVAILKAFEQLISSDDFFKQYNRKIIWIYSLQNGTGRTSLASILGKYCLLKKYRVRYFKGNELLHLLSDFDQKDAVNTILDEADVFILDDLFDSTRFFVNKLTKTELYVFLDTLINNKNKKLICTSNTSVFNMQLEYQNFQHLFFNDILEMEICVATTLTNNIKAIKNKMTSLEDK